MEVRFIPGEAALLAGDVLAVTDLHIGIEHEYRLSGIKMPSQTPIMRRRLEALLKRTKARSLVICGDLKHKVPGMTWQEEREVPLFLESLLERVEVHVVPGNHDADLKPLLPDGVELHPAKGFRKGGAFFAHGHTWPDPSFLGCGYLITGHMQPQVEIKDNLGYAWRERVWVRAGLDRKKALEKYGPVTNLPELIVLPSFNPMSGGLALNRSFPGGRRAGARVPREVRESPVMKLANMKASRLFLLDGTYLGELGRL